MDGNALQVIGTAGNEMWATGEWSEIRQGKNGEPIPVKGHYLDIYVREGDDWKVRLWDLSTGHEVLTLTTRLHYHTPLAFSADGDRLATGDVHGDVQIWSAERPEDLRAPALTAQRMAAWQRRQLADSAAGRQ